MNANYGSIKLPFPVVVEKARPRCLREMFQTGFLKYA